MAGPCRRNASWFSAGESRPATWARDVSAASGESRTPAAGRPDVAWIHRPARTVEPPNVAAFSTTRTRRPRWAAVSAAVIPAAPLPTTTTSNSVTLSSALTRTGYSFAVTEGTGGTTVDWDERAGVVVVGF